MQSEDDWRKGLAGSNAATWLFFANLLVTMALGTWQLQVDIEAAQTNSSLPSALDWRAVARPDILSMGAQWLLLCLALLVNVGALWVLLLGSPGTFLARAVKVLWLVFTATLVCQLASLNFYMLALCAGFGFMALRWTWHGALRFAVAAELNRVSRMWLWPRWPWVVGWQLACSAVHLFYLYLWAQSLLALERVLGASSLFFQLAASWQYATAYWAVLTSRHLSHCTLCFIFQSWLAEEARKIRPHVCADDDFEIGGAPLVAHAEPHVSRVCCSRVWFLVRHVLAGTLRGTLSAIMDVATRLSLCATAGSSAPVALQTQTFTENKEKDQAATDATDIAETTRKLRLWSAIVSSETRPGGPYSGPWNDLSADYNVYALTYLLLHRTAAPRATTDVRDSADKDLTMRVLVDCAFEHVAIVITLAVAGSCALAAALTQIAIQTYGDSTQSVVRLFSAAPGAPIADVNALLLAAFVVATLLTVNAHEPFTSCGVIATVVIGCDTRLIQRLAPEFARRIRLLAPVEV